MSAPFPLIRVTDPPSETAAALLELSRILDLGIVTAVAQSRTTSSPPAAPDIGDLYIVPAGATSTWASHVGHLAVWWGGWGYITNPREYWTLAIADESGQLARLESGTWTDYGGGDVVGPSSAVTGRIATFNGTSGKLIQDGGKLVSDLVAKADTSLTGYGWFKDEDDMASDDATKCASQQSIKAYVDTTVPVTITSGSSFPGSPSEPARHWHTTFKEWFDYSSGDSSWLGESTCWVSGYLAAGGGTWLKWALDGSLFTGSYGLFLPWDAKVTQMSFFYNGGSGITCSVMEGSGALSGASLTTTVLSSSITQANMNSDLIESGNIIGLKITGGTAIQKLWATAMLRRSET